MNKICALVVTYNRPELLLECIRSVINQSQFSISDLIIVDNFSNVETPMLLLDNGFIPKFLTDFIEQGGILYHEYQFNNKVIKIHYKRLNGNTGGAGGFNLGMRYFYEKTNSDFLWLMDDDCIPQEDSLANLILAQQQLSKITKVGFLASKTITENGDICYMTQPVIKKNLGLSVYSSDCHCLEIENAAFVSLFIERKIIKQSGYPIKEYFIWCDDLEFTTRVAKNYSGFLVLDSIVVHKTLQNLTALDEVNAKNFFKHKFGMRNKISWLLHYKSFLHALFYSLKFIKLIYHADILFINKVLLFKSIIYGWFFNPKIERVVEK
jgi:GT2 family glycosyltransferase